MARLKEFYSQEVAPAMMKKFGYKNVMEIPKVEKNCRQHGRQRCGRQS